jgi:hypothetical protein
MVIGLVQDFEGEMAPFFLTTGERKPQLEDAIRDRGLVSAAQVNRIEADIGDEFFD